MNTLVSMVSVADGSLEFIGFLLQMLIRGSLVLVVAGGVVFAFRRASASFRHTLWCFTFVGLSLSRFLPCSSSRLY